ncbi:MAG TPA: DUF983 domain-containing protein [Parvularculaceae bacterium]|nr:DUF983 domain-containing protein [Parvularculaceae bacterium]HNS87960.1 DUF983 domain-containing protein [Parvularculaceae bacterium]
MTYYPPVSAFSAGLAGKCPRCGQGALFQGFLGIRPRCEVCNLDFSKADSGDGPAVFVMFIVGFVAVAVAFVARFAWYAPMLAAFGVSAAVAIILSLALLRPFKATLIALQYRHKAEEGRLEE